MRAEIDIVCGPHVKLRRDSDTATVARAKVHRSEVAPGVLHTVYELHGVVEQRAYLVNGEEVWDEYVSPLYGDLAPYERRGFDERWRAAGDPLNAAYNRLSIGGIDIYEVAARERAVLRCPVCRNTLPVGDADELRSVLGALADAGASIVSLAGLRRARELNKSGEAGKVR